MSAGAPAVRRPRRDSERNRGLIVAAARKVLCVHGTDASMEQIAAGAGVGVGTVYRHFPSKDALIDHLLTATNDELAEAGARALERGDGTGLAQYLRTLGQSLVENRRYADLMLGRPDADCGARTIRRHLAALYADARAAGTLGPDVYLGDIMVLVWGMRGVAQTAGTVAPDAWRRFLDLHLAALGTAGPLSATPALTDAELTEIAPR